MALHHVPARATNVPAYAGKLPFMALHPPDCEICERIAQIGRSEHPGFIAELETGYVVLGDSQYFRGYTLFLCKQAAPDLEALPWEFRVQFLTEMALVSQAVATVMQPHKMNVESLGNMVPHLHWHLFPRQLSESEPTKPVWVAKPRDGDEVPYALDATRDDELKHRIKAEIEKLCALHS